MNKLIVVTGGTKGIGRAILEKFVKEGFDIVANSRTQSDLDSIRDYFKEYYPKSICYVFAADMADKHQVGDFVQFVSDLNRPIDV